MFDVIEILNLKKKKTHTHTHTLKKKIVDDIFVNYIWFVYWKKIRIIIINFESLIASFLQDFNTILGWRNRYLFKTQ